MPSKSQLLHQTTQTPSSHTLATSGELEKHCLVPTPETDVMVLRGCLAWEAGKAPQGVLVSVAGDVHCGHRRPLPPAVGLRTASAGPAETKKREQESSGYECISVHEGICLCQAIHKALSKRKTTIFSLTIKSDYCLLW